MTRPIIGKKSGKFEPPWVRFITGGIASTTAEACTLPIDLVKLRLQVPQTTGATQYQGFLNTFLKVSREEGIKSLWKGGGPALFRQISYSSIRMGLYEPIRDYISGSNKKNPSFLIKLISGGTAGSIGIFICNPIEVVKIRMQHDISRTRYNGMLSAFKHIFKNEGILGGWKGLLPNLTRVFVTNASEIASYDQSKELLVQRAGFSEYSLFTHFIGSIISGFIGACASAPVESIKNRLMSQPISQKLYSNAFDCIVKVIKNEGILAFYRGFFPLWLRLAPWNIVMWITYEQYRYYTQYIWDK